MEPNELVAWVNQAGLAPLSIVLCVIALYVVLGSHTLRRLLVPAVNDALAAIEID